MNPFIVVPDGFDQSLFNELLNNSQFKTHPNSKISEKELIALLPLVNGLIIRSSTVINKAFLDQAKNLKIIIRAGEGTDNIDKVLCQERGVKVANTPGANNNSAAEHAIALMMTVLRNTALADASMKASLWEKNALSGLELWKKKVGIVGFGRVGQIVAKRISGFEPEILFYDPMIAEDIESLNAKKCQDLSILFKTSDIITIHTPLMKETKNLITQDLLKLMKKEAILINAARGGIVDEEALYQILKEKKIRGAGFDVFLNEPLPTDSKLTALKNLVLTPHIGASTEEAQVRVGTMALHQISEFFKNNILLNEVRAK